jgi:hypothetical protein
MAFLGFIVFNLLNQGNNESYRWIQQFALTGLTAGIAAVMAFIGVGISNEAEKKGRDWDSFFGLFIFLGPILTAIIVAVLPYKESQGETKTSSSKDISSAIVELSALMNQGVITPAEFEKKKQELLKRI